MCQAAHGHSIKVKDLGAWAGLWPRALLIVDRSDGFVWGRAGLYSANA